MFRFFVVNANGFVNDGKPGVIVANPPINDGKWHHIAAVRDAGKKELRVYIYGHLVGETQDLTRALNSKPDYKKTAEIKYGSAITSKCSGLYDLTKYSFGIRP